MRSIRALHVVALTAALATIAAGPALATTALPIPEPSGIAIFAVAAAVVAVAIRFSRRR